jgi:hypothetical protein
MTAAIAYLAAFGAIDLDGIRELGLLEPTTIVCSTTLRNALNTVCAIVSVLILLITNKVPSIASGELPSRT